MIPKQSSRSLLPDSKDFCKGYLAFCNETPGKKWTQFTARYYMILYIQYTWFLFYKHTFKIGNTSHLFSKNARAVASSSASSAASALFVRSWISSSKRMIFAAKVSFASSTPWKNVNSMSGMCSCQHQKRPAISILQIYFRESIFCLCFSRHELCSPWHLLIHGPWTGPAARYLHPSPPLPCEELFSHPIRIPGRRRKWLQRDPGANRPTLHHPPRQTKNPPGSENTTSLDTIIVKTMAGIEEKGLILQLHQSTVLYLYKYGKKGI